jgi:hypothetical protein
MRRLRSAAGLLVVLLGLVGCAIPEVPYDRGTAGTVKRIGIVTPQLPKRAYVALATSPGKNLGLIGGLVDAALQSDRESELKKLLDQRNFAVESVITGSLAAGLQARGYEVVMLPMTRDKEDFAPSYPEGAPSPVDAYLDVVATGYGYVAAGVGSDTPWRPSVRLKVRLASAKGLAVLMQDTIVYNPIGTPDKTVTIAPDPALQYVNFNSLMADPDGAVNGLRVAIEQTAQHVCMLLQ